MSKKGVKVPSTIYGVIIHRRTTPLVVLESDDFEECKKLWEELQDQWVKASKELVPFVLKTPVMTAFEPALIYEISLIPVVEQTTTQSDNPYHRDMVQNGLGSTFRGRDLL